MKIQDAGATQSPKELLDMMASSRQRSRWRKIILLAAGGIVLLLIVMWLMGWLSCSDPGADGPKYQSVAVIKGSLENRISATGNLEALNTVEVGTEVSGRIQKLYADFNDPVVLNQILAEIDPEQHQASLEQASAQVLAANAGVQETKASLAEAQRDAVRSKELADRGLISKKELDAALTRATRAKASVTSSQASAKTAAASFAAAKTRLDKTVIRSPIQGTVLSRKVEEGQTLNAGMQTPVLFTIAEDLKRMRLSAKVDEADIAQVAVGQDAIFTVDAYPERSFDSQVVSVRNVAQVEQNVVSYEVLLDVANTDGSLKPGMTATVEIITLSQDNVLLVPNKALRFQPPGATLSFRGAPRPMGMPFGGGQRRPQGQQTPAAAARANMGKLSARDAMVWILQEGEPTAIKVVKTAANNEFSAIEGPEIIEGLQVLTELLDEGKK